MSLSIELGVEFCLLKDTSLNEHCILSLFLKQVISEIKYVVMSLELFAKAAVYHNHY